MADFSATVDRSVEGHATKSYSRESVWAFYALAVACYALVFAGTQTEDFGDSRYYARNVLDYLTKPHDRIALRNLLEFGHLLWRPLFVPFYSVFGNFYRGDGANGPYLSILALAIAVSIASGLLGLSVLYVLGLRLGATPRVAAGLSIAFGCLFAVLNFTHSGTPYMPGTAFTYAGFWLAVESLERRSRALAGGSGAALAIATLLWLPFVLALPPVIAMMLLAEKSDLASLFRRDRWQLAGWTAGTCGVGVAGAYAAAIVKLRLYSYEALHEWITAAAHGWEQNRRIFRLATGLPRGFISLGHDGAYYKRFVLHDAYEHVGLVELWMHSLWKLALFYAFAAVLVWVLWRYPAPPRIRASLALAAVLSVFFAVAVFEPGSTERFLVAFVFLFAAIATAIVSREVPKVAKYALTIALGTFSVVNVFSLSNPQADSRLNPARQRIRTLREVAKNGDLLVLPTNKDAVYEFRRSHPFDPLNRGWEVSDYDAIEPGTIRTAHWRQEFAEVVLATWRASHNVWLSKRLLKDRPASDAWWTDGDDPHVRWRDIAPYFRQFRFAGDVGGPDGFLLVDSSPENAGILTRIAAGQ
jgi:hypothetical protein